MIKKLNSIKNKPQIFNYIYEALIKKNGLNLTKKYKILWAEWWTDGRNIEQMKYVFTFMKDVMEWDIDVVSQFNPIQVLNNKYDFAILSGATGSRRAGKWAKTIFLDSSIPLFVSTTEGIYRLDELEEFVWGHLKGHKNVLWTYCSVWNEIALEAIKKNYPSIFNSYFISGSLGIDRHIICKKIKPYYDFGIALNDDIVSYNQVVKSIGVEYADNWLKTYHMPANKELIAFVKKFSSDGYSFLIKMHPGQRAESQHPVVKELSGLKNVEIRDALSPILDCISASKIWLTQNSSSSIEALAQSKDVYRIGNYPPFNEIYLKLPLLQELDKKLIDNGSLEDNISINSNYSSILENTIGFYDGFNHLRFINKIIFYLSENKTNKKRINFDSLFLWKSTIIHNILLIMYYLKLPFLKSFQLRISRFNIKKLELNLIKSSKELENYYSSNIHKIKKVLKI